MCSEMFSYISVYLFVDLLFIKPVPLAQFVKFKEMKRYVTI